MASIVRPSKHTTKRRETMADFKVTVTGKSGVISYTVYKTEKGAKSFGAKVANEAFYGESVTVEVVAL